MPTMAFFVFIAFSGSLSHDFVNYDDDIYVTENNLVLTGITPHNIINAFTHFYAANWHPLTCISHMLDVSIFGLNPYGHHLTNVLLHVANTILLYLFFSKASGCVWRSAAVALLFAIHPLHVESVAWHHIQSQPLHDQWRK